MAGNPNYGRVASTTLRNYAAKMADNVSKHIPLLGVMKEKGAVKLRGGSEIVLPVLGEFAPAQSYSGSDSVTPQKPTGMTSAEYNWKQLISYAYMEGIEMAQNNGPEKIQDLMENTIMQAEKSIEDALSVQMFADGTGNGGKDFLGLEAIASQNPAADVLGGIPGATSPYWRNFVNNAVGSFAANGLDAIQAAIRATVRGNDRTDLIVCGSTIYGYAQRLAFNSVQIQSTNRLAKLGFEALTIEGIDFVHDANCTADRIYGINTEYTKLYLHQDFNFKTTDFVTPVNQDIQVAKILVYGEFATNRRGANWVLSGINP